MNEDNFDIDKFNTDLTQSIKKLEDTFDKFFEINENSTLHEIALSLEYQEKKRTNRRLYDIENRLDQIEEIPLVSRKILLKNR